jgi:hypothetical protein
MARIMRSSAPEEIRHADDDEDEFGGEEDEFGDEEEEMDEWDMDDDEEADGIRVLASFRGHSAGGGDELEDEDEAAAAAAAEEEDGGAMPHPHLTEEWKRERALKGVHARKEKEQRRASKKARGSSGQFCGAQGQGAEQRQGTRKRDRGYDRREKERERLREKRAAAAHERAEGLRTAFAALKKFHTTGKVDHLIHTDEERFRAKGLESKIKDFGRATAHAPYRARAAALY